MAWEPMRLRQAEADRVERMPKTDFLGARQRFLLGERPTAPDPKTYGITEAKALRLQREAARLLAKARDYGKPRR